MSSPAIAPRYTPQEYLALERAAVEKSEYINGQIYPMGQPHAMAGARRNHVLLVSNINRELSQQLRKRPCEVYCSDMRVQVSETGLYTYPDVTVACGEIQVEDGDTLLNPTVIIEVLSPSTEGYDRGEKFAHYRRLASLTDYVLVSQDCVRVEHFVRQGNQWLLSEYNDLSATFDLTAIGCRLTLSDIYEKVRIPVETDEGRRPPPEPHDPALARMRR